MTAQTTDVYSGNLRSADSDEIDLRRYLLVLLKWWREILVISILAGVIAGIAITIFNTSRTPTYEASADVLIARLFSTIELDDRVSTSAGSGQGDANGWRTSLLQLVNNSVVATAVRNELNDELPAELRTPEALASLIDASVPLSPDERFSSNIIRITATTSDAVLSTKIANLWAVHLVDYVNGLYGEVPEAMFTSVTSERDNALLSYQAAQKEYEVFIGDNQIEVLKRQRSEKSNLRSEIMVNYTRMLTSVISTEYNAHINLYDTLANAPVEYARSLVVAQVTGNVQSLNLLYSLRASASAQIDQARNMERILVDGGEAAAKSNISALHLLKLLVFSSTSGSERLPAIVNFSDPGQQISMSLDEQLVDVRSLITVLDDYTVQLQDEIKQVSESTMSGADITSVGGLDSGLANSATIAQSNIYSNVTNAYAQLVMPNGILDQMPVDIGSEVTDAHELLLTRLEAEIRTLDASITAEEATQLQLVHQRDLAWTTYDTVDNKLQELSLLRSADNSEIRIANPAMTPLSALPLMGPVLPVVALTVIGFLFAVVVALFVDSFGGGPFFARRTSSPITQ